MTCYDCGGVNLQVKYWVNANDLSDFKDPCDDDDYWCSDCEDLI